MAPTLRHTLSTSTLLSHAGHAAVAFFFASLKLVRFLHFILSISYRILYCTSNKDHKTLPLR